MQLYEANGNVYAVDGDGKAHAATVTAKDKVVRLRELESVTVTPQKAAVKLPAGARPITINAVVRKFAVTEDNPVGFDKARHDKALREK